MKKAIAAVLAFLAMATPAVATPEITKQEEEDHVNLVSLVKALGIPVIFDDPVCKKGWYGGYNYDGSAFLLCKDAPGGQAERLDTIRHEAFHVYADLARDCSITDNDPIQPVFFPGVVPPSFITMASKNYKPAHVSTEAEAAWAANTFSAEQINILLYNKARSCGFRF
jgi:hypothetical protein